MNANEDKSLGHLRNKCNPRPIKKGRPANVIKSNQDTAYSPVEATTTQLEEASIFSMDNSKNMYGFGALVSPILPFARTNQMELKYKANLVGEKIINPTIHFCDLCDLPILIYGRMIPCKHVFCFNCANKSDKLCIRCSEKIFKIEKCNLGTVYMCGTDSCKRTYLSQRDLEAHIKHRHVRKSDLPQRL